MDKKINLSDPLDIKDIDFRVQSINRGGYATILAYKDARVDMNRLDAVYTPTGWQRKHELINSKEFCSVGIKDAASGDWIWKQDCGTKSYTESEKGETSDAFKRACFNWGIGRELYDYPFIQVELKDNEYKVDGNKVKATWELNLKSWKWECFFVGKKVGYLKATDVNRKERFLWFSLDGLEKTIDAIKKAFGNNDIPGMAEAWYELCEGEKAALWVAQSKGGPFNTAEKAIIQSPEFRKLKPLASE